MKILIYRRTHKGDPDQQGRFGINGCMGGVRGYGYDAVIGVGGTGDEPRAEGLSLKVNWVGRYPRKRPNPVDPRGPLVSFLRGNFRLMEDRGPLLSDISPLLAEAVYGRQRRFLFTSIRGKLAAEARRVITELLDTDRYPDGPTGRSRYAGRCGPRRCFPRQPVADFRTARCGGC